MDGLTTVRNCLMRTRADTVPSTSHVGNAGSTPAGITKQIQGFTKSRRWCSIARCLNSAILSPLCLDVSQNDLIDCRP